MAVQWLENNQTKIVTNQWGEDIYGLKATNVFGLAWNYYLAYTKFITGLDLTMDMGRKIELFYAKCFKLGYATEYKMTTIEAGKIQDSFFAFLQKKVEGVSFLQQIIDSRTAVVAEENFAAEVRNADVSADDLAGLTSVEEWAVSKDISAPVFTLLCSTGATLAAGTGLAAFSADGLSLDGLIIELA